MKKLENILEEYYNTREVFRSLVSSDEKYKEALLEIEHRFIEIKADLRPWHTKMISASTRRDDKACTGIKFRIAISMVRGEYKWEENEKPMYEKPPSIGYAEKYASASKEYTDFLEQRAFYKESITNINDILSEVASYINLIKDRLKQ